MCGLGSGILECGIEGITSYSYYTINCGEIDKGEERKRIILSLLCYCYDDDDMIVGKGICRFVEDMT